MSRQCDTNGERNENKTLWYRRRQRLGMSISASFRDYVEHLSSIYAQESVYSIGDATSSNSLQRLVIE